MECYNANIVITGSNIVVHYDSRQCHQPATTHWAWASYQIRKIAGWACTGIAGSVFPATDFKGILWLVIPACITARASRMCRDACRDR